MAEDKKELTGTVSQITKEVQDAARQGGENAKLLEARVLNTVAAARVIAQAPPRVFIHIFDEGQRQLNRNQYDAAIAALQAARRLSKTDAVEALLNRAMAEQAAAIARSKGEAERRELERRLAAERQRSQQAEAQAKRNQELYAQGLQLAQKAMADKNYEAAQAKYEEAARAYRTDVALTGQREAAARLAEVRSKAALEQKQKAEEAQKAETLRRLLQDGQAALAAGQHDRAVQAFGQFLLFHFRPLADWGWRGASCSLPAGLPGRCAPR